MINIEKIIIKLSRLTNLNCDDVEILCLPGSTISNHCTLILIDINLGPNWVIKISRTIDDKSLNDEKKEIYFLSESCAIKPYLPKLLSYFDMNNRCVLVTEYVNGRVLSPKVNSLDVPNYNIARNHFKSVENFIEIYYKLNYKKNRVKFVAVNKICDKLKYILDNNIITKFEYNFVYKIITQLKLYKYSRQHGDFTRHNILENNDKIIIIDWTDTKLNLVVDDIFYFITNYFLQYRNKLGINGIIQAFNYTFFDKNDYSELVFSTINKLLSIFDINQKDFGKYFLIFLLNRFVDEYDSIKKIPIESRGNFNMIISGKKNTIKEEILWYHYIVYTIGHYDNLRINNLQ